jgi:hypothetical protein
MRARRAATEALAPEHYRPVVGVRQRHFVTETEEAGDVKNAS